MRVSKQVFNDAWMTDSNSLAKALLQAPAKLSPAITNLGGREDNQFPLTMLTEGVGNSISIGVDEYEYPVKTRANKVRALSSTVGGGSGLGKGGATFNLPFNDRWFIKDYVLISQSGIQVRIMGEPVPDGVNHLYPVRLVEPDPELEFPASDLVAGATFAQLFAPVGKDFSRGNASNWSVPGKVRHKLSTIRKSYQVAGAAKDFVSEFEFEVDGKKTKLWMDYEEWQHFLEWKQEAELLYWYGRQSYNEAGITSMRDENGQPVIIGPGLLQQIVNKETYSELTVNKLKNTVRDLFYGMTDAQKKQITLYTGIGGAEEFSNALKAEANASGYTATAEGKFIGGEGRALKLTGYFTTYEHIDGHTINVVKAPMFDHGPVATARRKHPRTGLSLESYRMVFVDQSNYDGQANLVMVNRKNREMKRWAVAGSTVPKGYGESPLRASDVDGYSVHFLKQGGVCLRRFDTSLDMECVID